MAGDAVHDPVAVQGARPVRGGDDRLAHGTSPGPGFNAMESVQELIQATRGSPVTDLGLARQPLASTP